MAVHPRPHALVVADMPFGSYEIGPQHALENAFRIFKETGAHAVKLEGGERVAPQIAALTAAGIPVMAHIGFTPQSVNGLGGFRVQGRGDGADQLVADAIADTLAADHDPSIYDMSEYAVEDLDPEDFLVIVCSTYGEGELPTGAEPFADELESVNPDLTGLRFAVFGLGDSIYDTFNRGGEIVAAERWPVRPPTGPTSFSRLHTQLHGVDEAAVADAPDWPEVAAQLDLLGEHLPFVASGADRDRGAYEAATRATGGTPQEHEWRDALTLVGRLRPDVDPPRIATAAQALGIPDGGHPAGSGSEAVRTAEVVLALARQSGRGTVRRLWSEAAPPAPDEPIIPESLRQRHGAEPPVPPAGAHRWTPPWPRYWPPWTCWWRWRARVRVPRPARAPRPASPWC